MPSTPTIAFLTNSVTGHYQSSLWKELLPRARTRGWNLLTLIGRHSIKRPEPVLVAMNSIFGLAGSRRVDGIIALGEIIYGAGDFTGMERYFERFGGKPLVLIASSIPGRPSVRVDGRQGINDALRHLAAGHGRRRIAYLRGPADGAESEERFGVYKEALEPAGLSFDPAIVFPGDYTEASGIWLAGALARGEVPSFDALMTGNDRMAIGFQTEAIRLGLKIPDDVAITGFDDDEESVVLPKPLSTVRQPFPLMAERSLEAMDALLRGRTATELVTLPARFIARESCGCSGELRGPEDATPPAGATGIVRLREALIADAEAAGKTRSFDAMLAAQIDYGSKDKRDLYDLSTALASTRRRLEPSGIAPDALHRAERILLEGQLSVALRIERAYARELIDYEKAHLIVNDLTSALAESLSKEDLIAALSRFLPQFDLRFAALSTPVSGAEAAKGALPPLSTLDLLIAERGGRLPETLIREPAPFDTLDVLPDGAMPPRKPWSATAIPLVDRGVLVGILFLESRKVDTSLYAIFRSQIGGTIGRIVLLGELLDRETRERVEAEKMAALGTLVAGVAHEVNTPVGVGVTAASHLSASLAALALLRKTGKLPMDELDAFIEDSNEATSLILSNLQRAASLIASFKRIAVDSSSEERRRFEVRESITDIVASLSPRLKRTKVSVEIDCEGGLQVDGYPGPFSQVIANFIVNSLEHAYEPGSRGSVRIHARAEGDRLKLVYEDDGRGIPKEHLGRIFEPFFTTSRESGGAGLGLHIVYNAVTGVMGGKVSASNRPEGGARFTVDIPMTIDGDAHG